MSFLQDEAAATLDEALAFIDSWNECGTSDSTASEGEGGSSPGSSPDASPSPVLKATDPNEKEKRRRASGYSMKLQRRKKQELAALRDQAKVLEAELGRWKQLQSQSATRTQQEANAFASGQKQLSTTAAYDWHRAAIVQLQERQRAEKTNRKLLELLKKQARVSDAVRRVLQKSSTIPGLENILGSPRPTARHPLAGLDHSRLLLSQLEGAVESMRLDCGFMLKPTEPRSVSTTMTIKGSLVEITTTTPMACSMQAASAWLWANLSTLREYPDKAYNYLRQSKPDTVEKNYVMTLRGRPFSLQVNGLQLLRRYEEPDRVLLVRSNHLLLPTESLHFRNNCWTSVTPADTNPHGASVVRTCVQLYADCKDGLSINPRDLDGVKDLALDSLSGMYRKHAQMMQNALIEERGGIATAV